MNTRSTRAASLRSRWRPWWGLAACLGLALAGCSRLLPQDAVKVFPVGGTLSYRGEPMKGAVITFHSASSKLTAQATADQYGDYLLTTYLTNDGAPADEYTVTIHWPVENFKPTEGDPDPPLPPDRLEEKYANPKTSTLKATVLEEPTTVDFNLK